MIDVPAELVSVRALRALAARHGVPLGPVADVDASASVASASIWEAVTGRAVTAGAVQDRAATFVLAALLRRAAGAGVAAGPVLAVPGPVPSRALPALEAAASLPGPVRSRVLADLVAGGTDGPFAAAANVLEELDVLGVAVDPAV